MRIAYCPHILTHLRSRPSFLIRSLLLTQYPPLPALAHTYRRAHSPARPALIRHSDTLTHTHHHTPSHTRTATHAFNAWLQTIVSRRINPATPTVLTVGSIHCPAPDSEGRVRVRSSRRLSSQLYSPSQTPCKQQPTSQPLPLPVPITSHSSLQTTFNDHPATSTPYVAPTLHTCVCFFSCLC
jgi:hypothetical protein